MKVTLPITGSQSRIMKVVDTAQSCIIQGKTGCGKSTQVPQFILDSCREKNARCNIVVTQPRRIAAISLARRVCAERNWELGTIVGYQVGLDREHQSSDTRLLYCTTGVLLQMLIGEKTLTRFTHIILDEVHERSQDMDFLFIIVKRLLILNSKHVKVVLMSATIEVSRFTHYFTYPGSSDASIFFTAPSLDLGSQADTPFNIEIFYLCSLQHLVSALPDINMEDPGISLLGYKVAVKLIESFDRIEKDTEKRGAVLVFLPGIHEIEELFNMLTEGATENRWWIKPLHSTITTHEQELVFKRPPQGCRKIILSTNIAESSITVPDITFVVDFVLTKNMVCDPNTNFQCLQLSWAAKNNCIQRAGRAGRLAAGRVFRLVPQIFFEGLHNDSVPEMQRGSLERTVLQTKLLDMGPPKAILGLAMDPPDLTRIEQTILLLKEKGALLTTCNGEKSEADGDITFIGRVMAKLPVDPIISKLIVLGHVFSVLPECIIMGAAMSLKSVFSTPFQERLKAYHSKLTWADSSCSDCISFLNAYTVWQKNKEVGYFLRSVGGGEAEWAQRYHIQLQTMHEVHQLVQEIQMRLQRMNIEVPKGVGRVHLTNVEKPLVLKIVLAGAFYPNYYVRGLAGGQVNEREAVRVLDGRDPFSTIYLQNFPSDQPRRLYAKRIRDALQDCCPEIQVAFDNSSKVYVQFGQHQFPGMIMHNHNYVATIPGKVAMGVYRAIKFRQLGIPILVPLLKPADAKKRAVQLGLPASETESMTFGRRQPEGNIVESVKKFPLPSIDTTYLQLQISHVVDAGHFWAQTIDTNATEQQGWMYTALFTDQGLVPLRGRPKIGNVYAAKYVDESQYYHYYRARVDAISERSRNPMVQVFYIDYGNSSTINEGDLKDFGPSLIKQGILEVPAQAFECVLAKVQPSVIRNDTGLWTHEATVAVMEMTNDQICYGSIYSVVNGVIHLELLLQNKRNVNRWLIEEQYAVEAEESYLSQENNKLRNQPLQPFQLLHYEEQQLPQAVDPALGVYVEPPCESECYKKQKLRGPTSPLEMQVYSLTRIGQRRDIHIDKESVNSVLLDTDPQDPHERLLVAACIGENAAGDRIMLRHTTLMPNIHGLVALVSLIFAPNIELRTDYERTRFTGAICGLGFDRETRISIFPDHDMEVNFDTEITADDLENINRLRLWMNECLVPDDMEDQTISEQTVLKAQINAKSALFKLIQRKQKSCELHMYSRPMFWGQVKPVHMLPPTQCQVMLSRQKHAIFRLHWGVRLKLTQEEATKYKNMLENHEELQKISCGLKDPEPSNYCLMCDVPLGKANVLRAHLATLQHRDKCRLVRTTIDADSD